MDTLYQIGFKSGGTVTLTLKTPQAFIDALVSSLNSKPQAARTWYGEPGALFQVDEIAYVLPDAAIQQRNHERHHNAMRDARERMEEARKGMALAFLNSNLVEFSAYERAFDKAASDFDAAFDKLTAG